MTLNGDILDTVDCDNDDKLGGTLFDIRFCDLHNISVITHEASYYGQYIVKREKTGKVTMTSRLFDIHVIPITGGVVCTSDGIVLILDINNEIHFVSGKVVSSMCLKDLKILHAEILLLDKHDRVGMKGKHKDETRDGGVYINGLSK